MFNRAKKILQQNGLYEISDVDNGYMLNFWFNDEPETFYKVVKGRNGNKFKFTAGPEEYDLARDVLLEEGNILIFDFEMDEKVWFACPQLLIDTMPLAPDEVFG